MNKRVFCDQFLAKPKRRQCTASLALVVTVLTWVTPRTTAASATWSVGTSSADSTGKEDCTSVFQKLLDDAGHASGGIVEVPAGKYRINGNLSIPANVTLQGVFRVPPTPSASAAGNLTGSVLAAYAGRGSTNGPAFIRLAGNNAAIEGLIIAYPEWKQSDVPPVPYPPCILAQDAENVGVRDCCLLNPYEGIRLVRAARHLVRNVTGYPIKRGLFVDECYDIGHVENVHFWPFGVSYNADEPFCKWVNTQGVAFEFARTDWHYVHNTFCFGYGVGYRFSKSPQGSANGNFLGLGADSCERAVVVEQAQPPGLLICNGEFVGRWNSTNSVCLEILPGAEGKVSLANCSFWGPIDRCVWMRSPSGQFTASACNFVDWDNNNLGSPAIQLDAGKAIIQGSTFQSSKLDVSVGSNVLSAIITGNQANGGFRVNNFAGKRTQSLLNEEDNIDWPENGPLNYRILVGAPGDTRYLELWHNQERGFRWSAAKSLLRLPVKPGKAYTCRVKLNIPPQAVDPESGFYLQGKRLAALESGSESGFSIPPAAEAIAIVELRCHGWVPAKTQPGSQDQRTLGVQLHEIQMTAESAENKTFDANNGIWLKN